MPLLAIGAAFASAGAAAAAWLPGGTPVAGDQADEAFPVVTSDRRSGATIAWQEFGRIYAQRLTPDGQVASGWPADHGLEVCPGGPQGAYMQSGVRIASDDRGGCYVVWHDERRAGCQYFCSDQLREIYVERIGEDGRIAVGWPDSGLPVGSSQWYQIFTSGTARVQATDFNTVVAPDGSGGLLLVWQEGPPFSGDSVATVRAQRVSENGKLLWGPRGVLVCAAGGVPSYPTVVSDRRGGAIVVWEDSRSGSVHRLYGQHVSDRGECLWVHDGLRVIRGSAANEGSHVSCEDGAGGVFIAWEARTAPDSSRVMTQRVSAGGRLAWMSDRPLTMTLGNQRSPAVAADADGGAIVCWLDARNAGSVEVFVQRMTSWGGIARGWPADGARASDAPGPIHRLPTLVPDFEGGAYVAWYDGPFLPRATHLLRDGKRSPAWSPGGDHLSDQLGDSQLGLVTDGFHGACATWSEGRPPTGNFSMVLAQRLRPLGPASDELADTLGAGPPAISDTLEVSILGCSPNPSHGAISVTLALPTNQPARVELLDLLGRRIETFDIGALGRGRHTVQLEVGKTVPTGIYVVRLSQSGRSCSAKVVHAS